MANKWLTKIKTRQKNTFVEKYKTHKKGLFVSRRRTKDQRKNKNKKKQTLNWAKTKNLKKKRCEEELGNWIHHLKNLGQGSVLQSESKWEGHTDSKSCGPSDTVCNVINTIKKHEQVNGLALWQKASDSQSVICGWSCSRRLCVLWFRNPNWDCNVQKSDSTVNQVAPWGSSQRSLLNQLCCRKFQLWSQCLRIVSPQCSEPC